jgi:hypothetical protein
MDYLHALAVKDEELLKCAVGEDALPYEAREHLEQCPICQQRLTEYRGVYRGILTSLYRYQCPSATNLNHFCASLLSDFEARRIADHVASCPLCAAEVADIQSVLNTFDPFPI